MVKKRNFGVVMLVLICLTISAIFGIAYATFTSTINISGSATVKTTKWEVKFTAVSAATTNGNASTTTAPTISNNTTINGFTVTLAKPGDYVYYDLTVSNTGDYNAKIQSAVTKTYSVTCDGSGTNNTNAQTYIKYDVTNTSNAQIAANTALNTGNTYKVRVKVYYDANTPAENLITSAVSCTTPSVTIPYVQA